MTKIYPLRFDDMKRTFYFLNTIDLNKVDVFKNGVLMDASSTMTRLPDWRPVTGNGIFLTQPFNVASDNFQFRLLL